MKRTHFLLAGVALTAVLSAVGISAESGKKGCCVKACAPCACDTCACDACACAAGQPMPHNINIAEALEKIAAARTALNNGDTDTAMASLTTAEQALQAVRLTVVNTRCPMMGTKIEPNKVPVKLTREFQGQTVGFCCGGCPAAWDNLSDDAKTEKLRQATHTN